MPSRFLSWQRLLVIIILIGFLLSLIFLLLKEKKTKTPRTTSSYHINIVKETTVNQFFRRVLFTGSKSQLVVMSIPPGSEVGEEIHKYTEQTLFFLSGTGEGELGNMKFPIAPGDVVVVTPGTKHNFRNTGREALKIYTVYAPPNHIDGRIHPTKEDADADFADEAIGELEPQK